MKKMMLALIIAALAATATFAQETPWTNVMDHSRTVLRPQVPIVSQPVVDAKGVVTYPVSEYKIVLYYPVKLEDANVLPGYRRTISMTGSPVYKVQIKDGRNNVSIIERVVNSFGPFRDPQGNDFIKVTLVVPSNYISIYLYFDAVFTPIQAGEDTENRKIISVIGHKPDMFVQPAVIPANNVSQAQNSPVINGNTQFTPVNNAAQNPGQQNQGNQQQGQQQTQQNPGNGLR